MNFMKRKPLKYGAMKGGTAKLREGRSSKISERRRSEDFARRGSC
jgi:hypothetical protein